MPQDATPAVVYPYRRISMTLHEFPQPGVSLAIATTHIPEIPTREDIQRVINWFADPKNWLTRGQWRRIGVDVP